MEDKKIECPKCWVEMNRKKVEVFGPDISIDMCPECEGLWLDKGEMNRLLKDKELSDYLTKHIGTKSESELMCPRCGHMMDIEKADEIEVDVCLNCRGVWLDSGELEKLQDISDEGFEGVKKAKQLEKYEETQHMKKLSLLDKFLWYIKR